MMRRGLVLLFVLSSVALPRAQQVSLEYHVKAAYLYNFTRFVDWPASRAVGPLAICIAVRNVFGPVLDETLRGEIVNGRPLTTRVVRTAETGCHVLFVPSGVTPAGYLRAMRSSPVLTVGETPNFIQQGGVINFILDGENVRFEISPQAAERAQLRISSRLLQLARIVNPGDRGE